MKKLYMLVGLPGSGKSSYAKILSKNLIDHDIKNKIFSSDEYRLKVIEEGGIPDNNKIFTQLYKDLRVYMSEGGSAIFDATNITYKARRKTFEALRGIDYEAVAVILCPRVEKCIERNLQRTGFARVPVQVIYDMMLKFEMPQMFEGFTDIVIKHSQEPTQHPQAGTLLLEMMGFDQRTKYHKYSLGKHCDMVALNYDQGSVLYYAGLWHDVAKMYTQKIGEDGNAHYYSHENCSAYYVLTHPWLVNYNPDYSSDLREIIFYINHHMHIRDILKSEKAIKRYKELWGEERFRNLVEFMNNDNAASGRVINEDLN